MIKKYHYYSKVTLIVRVNNPHPILAHVVNVVVVNVK